MAVEANQLRAPDPDSAARRRGFTSPKPAKGAYDGSFGLQVTTNGTRRSQLFPGLVPFLYRRSGGEQFFEFSAPKK